ncbi:MAG: M50 family metallopeptidase [Verrucomicrobiales bacterium]
MENNPLTNPPERSPNTPNEWGIIVIISLFFGLFIALEVFSDFSPVKLSVPFFLASWILLLVIHEGSHALVAKAMGWHVAQIVIGSGQRRGGFTIARTQIEFRSIPLSGFVIPLQTDNIAPRLKHFCIYAAGPGVELLFAAILGALIGPDTLLQRTGDIPTIAAQSFIMAAFLGSFINLLPFSFVSGGQRSWSDGLGMILCWRLPENSDIADQDRKSKS